MLDVRKLRLLRELHARGTVAAVADALDYTPSAVSQQLAQLQREAGVPLTERVGRRLRLTDAGLRLVAHTDSLVARLEEAEADLQTAAGAVRGRLVVASLQTPMLSLVPAALRLLAGRHPELRVELREMEPEAALPALALGELDAAVAEEYDFAPRPLQPELIREELGGDEVVVVLAADHPAAREDGPIRLGDLADDPWICPYDGTRFAEMVMRACRLAGFEPEVRHRSNDAAIILALVAAGAGVALVPTLARPADAPGVVGLRVADHDLRRTIHVFTRRPGRGRPTLDALVEALREGALEHVRPPAPAAP